MQKKAIAILVFTLVLAVSTVYAQSAQELIRTHQYTAAISQVGAEASGARAFWLGQAHRQRGDALRDLARLQAHLGAAYYTERAEEESARDTEWTAYYAARYQVALNPTGKGAAQLQTLAGSGNLPSGYAPRAQVWVGYQQHAQGSPEAARATWAGITRTAPGVQADLAWAHWLAGEPLPALRCGSGSSPAARRCALWAAVRAQNWTRVAEVQEQLLNATRPADEVAQFEDYAVRFYDPGTLWALAAADFRAAAAAYQRATGQREDQAALLAALCAVDGRDYEAAQSLLDAAMNHPLRAAYRAVLAQETGASAGAGFNAVRQNENAGVRAVWAELAAPYPAQRDAVQTYTERQAQNPPERMNPALRLGRAALTLGAPGDAYAILSSAYPTTRNNDLQAISPAYLATFARAKFQRGRQYQSQVLSHLNALQQALPVVSIIYDLAQGYYVPERRTGNVR